MDYIRTEADGQLALTQSTEYLFLPSCLYGFHNIETTVETAKSKRIIYCHRGFLDLPEEERLCSCGQRMHINSHPDIYIRHLSIGGNLSGLLFPHNQLRCPKCGATKSQFISFKADGHLITDALHQYTCDLLARGTYTNKQVAEITGLGENTVKEIDKTLGSQRPLNEQTLYNNYHYIDLSMGLNAVSIARYLITHCDADSVIYGNGIRVQIVSKMLRERENIVPCAIIGENYNNELVEGIKCINRSDFSGAFRVAFIATEAYSDDVNKRDIDEYLRGKSAELILDMNRYVMNCVFMDFYGFYYEHKKDFVDFYDEFEDELSKDTYYHYIKAILTGNEYRGKEFSEQYKYWGGGEGKLIFSLKDEVWVNVGACYGDTIGELLEADVPIKHIYAIEAHQGLCDMLHHNIMFFPDEIREKISVHNVFVGNGEKESSLDNIVGDDRVTLINMDIEGAEIDALKTAKRIISTQHPVLAICAYHKPDDIFTISGLVKSLYPGYKFYFRKYYGTGGRFFFMGSAKLNEFVLYAVPEERKMIEI